MTPEQLQGFAVRAGGTAVVGLNPDAGLIAALVPHHPQRTSLLFEPRPLPGK